LAGFEVTLYGRFWVTPEGFPRQLDGKLKEFYEEGTPRHVERSRIGDSVALAIVATCLAPESVNAFFGDDRHHHQSSHRIGPPPAEERIQQQTAQQAIRNRPQ
jgi:hypothetical protein